MKSPGAGDHDNMGKMVEIEAMGKKNTGILIDEDDGAWHLFVRNGEGHRSVAIWEKAVWASFRVSSSLAVDTTPFRGVV